MGMYHLFLLLVAAFVASSRAREAVSTKNTSYIIVTSDAVIPGTELVIDLHLLDLIASSPKEKGKEEKEEEDECILDLRITADEHLWLRSAWKIEVDDKPKSFRKNLKILVPLNESSIGKTHELNIESISCFKFSHTIEVPFIMKDLLVSIQTDKSEYQPGEYVLIKSLVLTHELKPHWKPVNLSIHDSVNNVVVRWLNITAEEGLISKQFWIPLLSNLSELFIILESHEQRVNHTIQVALPFGAREKLLITEIRSPRYITVHTTEESKTPNLNISVAASHKSGIPVSGNVSFSFSLVGNAGLIPMPPVHERLETGYKLLSLDLEKVRELVGLPKEKSLVGHKVKVLVTVWEQNSEKDEQGKEEMTTERTEVTKVSPPSEEGNKTKLESGSDHERNATEGKEESRGTKKSNKIKLIPFFSATKEIYVTIVNQSHVLFFGEFTPQFFKPGLSYNGQILLKMVNESLLTNPEEHDVKVKVKHYISTSEKPKEEELTLKMKSHSIQEFSVKVHEKTLKLELEASFNDKESGNTVIAHLEDLLPFSSEDGHHIQVLLNQELPKVVFGEDLKVKIESTFPADKFWYQIICQSQLVLSGNVSLPAPTTSHEMSIQMQRNASHLLSSPRLVVLALTPRNEIVADSLRFVVEQEKAPLKLELMSREVEPGSMVELMIKAEPYTDVHLLITKNLLVTELEERKLRESMAQENMIRYLRHLNSSRFTEIVEDLCENCRTIPSLAPDSVRVLNESSCLLLTNGTLYKDSSKVWPIPSRKNGTLDNLDQLQIESLLEFESRFWRLNVTVGPTGEEKFGFEVPKEAKLYTLAAFGLKPGKGLVVAEEPIQLSVTSKLGAELRHPETLVRGEEFVLELLLFNNQEKDVEVEVKIKKDERFDLLCMEDEMTEGRSNVLLKPKKSKTIPLIIKTSPTLQESLHIELEVVSADVHWKLNTTVNVEYQGYKVELSNHTILDSSDGDHVISIKLPKDVKNSIEKSERAHVKIYGHPLGPAIEHVCREMNESASVLEEMTKIWFVQAIGVLEHISNNSLFDASVEVDYDERKMDINGSFGVEINRDECIKTVRDALDYTLSKRKPDGSFSFYPNSPGYIWLTTLMLEANIRLAKVRYLDEKEVAETIEWLIKQQKEDGSFIEKENVDNMRPDLDKLSYNVALTSRVISSLLEAFKKLELLGTAEQIYDSTEKAIKFIMGKVRSGDLDKDAYSLNLAAYALALANSDEIFEVLVKRDRLVVDEGEPHHWIVELEEISERRSLSVEATSYGLLTYLAMNDLQGASQFVDYLTSQMRSKGEFLEAEDTNVALKALSEYHRQHDVYHQHEQMNVEVNITLDDKKPVSLKVLDPLFVGELYFVESNLSLSDPVKVATSGEGLILVQNIAEHNEDTPSSPPKPETIDLKVEVQKKDAEHVELKICAENLEKGKTGFLIGHVPLLSGYDIDIEKLERSRDLQVLKQNNHVFLFFNEVEPSSPKCVELSLEKIFEVGNLQSRFISLYPVNDPDLSVQKAYWIEKLEGDRLCPK